MVLTSIQLTEADYKFCKDNHFQFSELMRSAIDEKKKIINGITVENIDEARRKLQIFKDLNEKANRFIEQEGLIDKYLGIEEEAPKEEIDSNGVNL